MAVLPVILQVKVFTKLLLVESLNTHFLSDFCRLLKTAFEDGDWGSSVHVSALVGALVVVVVEVGIEVFLHFIKCL